MRLLVICNAMLLSYTTCVLAGPPIDPLLPETPGECEEFSHEITAYIKELSAKYNDCYMSGGQREVYDVASCSRFLRQTYAPRRCSGPKSAYCSAISRYEGAVRRCMSAVSYRALLPKPHSGPLSNDKDARTAGELAKGLNRATRKPSVLKKAFEIQIDSVISAHEQAIRQLNSSILTNEE